MSVVSSISSSIPGVRGLVALCSEHACTQAAACGAKVSCWHTWCVYLKLACAGRSCADCSSNCRRYGCEGITYPDHIARITCLPVCCCA
jgi:hypothetical protein